MIPALIFDRGGRLDLAATRLLGRQGVPVHLLLARGRTTASYSRYCRGTHDVPGLDRATEDQVVSALVDVASRLADRTGERPVMVFTWERMMLLVARHREQLDRFLRIDLPPLRELDRAIDKRQFASHAEAAGLPVPRSVEVTGRADLERALELSLPAFIKPPTNMVWGDLPGRLGIAPKGARVDTRAELERLLTAFLSEDRPAIVQDYVDGPDVGHASVHMYREPATGRALAVGTVRRARVYPVGAGLGSYVVSEPLEMLIQPSLHAAEVMGLVGTMSVQWKHDGRRGWRILEIGPRIALSMGGSDAWGVNIPMTAYRSLCGLEVPRPHQRYGVAWIDLARDLESLREYRRRGDWSTLRWLWSLRRVRRCGFFAPDDLRPWVQQVAHHATY